MQQLEIVNDLNMHWVSLSPPPLHPSTSTPTHHHLLRPPPPFTHTNFLLSPFPPQLLKKHVHVSGVIVGTPTPASSHVLCDSAPSLCLGTALLQLERVRVQGSSRRSSGPCGNTSAENGVLEHNHISEEVFLPFLFAIACSISRSVSALFQQRSCPAPPPPPPTSSNCSETSRRDLTCWSGTISEKSCWWSVETIAFSASDGASLLVVRSVSNFEFPCNGA